MDGETLRLIEAADLALLLQGGQDLAHAMDQTAAALADAPADRFEFSWETPLGTIALNGSQNNNYGTGPYLLLLDTGGNDTYASGGATTSASHPISLLIDLAGDDIYRTAGGLAFGVGVLGYGLLLDAAGDDLYRADHLACGAASFGVGLLLDRAGKDRYELDRVGQGAAFFGAGVLSDGKGNDEYRCFMQAQGFGGTRGCGVLVDREGNDHYEAEDTRIRYPSPQTKEHNTSLARAAPSAGGHTRATATRWRAGSACWWMARGTTATGAACSARGSATGTGWACWSISTGTTLTKACGIARARGRLRRRPFSTWPGMTATLQS